MSYVPNFVVEILLILTRDLGSADQTMNDSPFYVIWVAEFEAHITTSMDRFLIHFNGQFGLFFMAKTSKKGVISFNCHCKT
jgi:hypothetical protein